MRRESGGERKHLVASGGHFDFSVTAEIADAEEIELHVKGHRRFMIMSEVKTFLIKAG
jgi:hypothetical protein